MRAPRLFAAIMVSLAVHAALVTWLAPTAPTPFATRLPLEAQLVPLPAPPRHTDATPDPQPIHTLRRAAPRPPAVATPLLAEATPPALPAEPAASEPPAAGDAPPSESPPALAEAPVTVPSAAAAPNLPKRAELTYMLYLGTDKFSVGRAVFTWEIGHGSYRLVSASETTGIVDLFRSQRLTYISEGTLTEDGLRPENFAMSRTRRGQTDGAQAHLDWAARRLTYGRPEHKRIVDLPPASQDIVSFVFQLALHPPAPGRVRLPITNGVRFETYELEVLAEERIETPLGLLDTLPLKQLRKEGAEGIEVWLAVDYRYLPVKVRFLDRDGNPAGEQIVSEIRISQ